MSMTVYDILRRPRVTERRMRALDDANTYGFEVHPKSNKVQIRNAVEKLFKVKVLAVRTATVRGKMRYSRTAGQFRSFQSPTTKKAYVRLKEGDSIELM
jgi:large subunit ribosomal protein L23